MTGEKIISLDEKNVVGELNGGTFFGKGNLKLLMKPGMFFGAVDGKLLT